MAHNVDVPLETHLYNILKGVISMRFVCVKNEYINVDSIQSYRSKWNSTTKSTDVRVTLTNGDVLTDTLSNAFYWDDELTGARFVVQVIPCNCPTWAVWKMEDDTYDAQRVYYLGLCADGDILPLCLTDGHYEVEDSSNFVGLYGESELSQFANLEKNDPACNDQ